MGNKSSRSVPPSPFLVASKNGSASQFPGAMGAEEALLALILANVGNASTVFRALLDRLAHVALTPGMTRIYESLFDRGKCLTRGRRTATTPVISDAVAIFSTTVPLVLVGALPGFGPARMRFAIEQAVRHQRAWLRLTHTLGQKAAVSSEKSASIDGARQKRGVLKGLISSATPATGPLRAALDGQVETRARSAVELVSSVQSIQVASEALLHRAEQDPDHAAVLADMGISRELVNSLASETDAVVEHGRAHRVSKSDLKRAWDELNTLDGITWFHLEEIVRAVERARVLGRDVPHVEIEAIKAVRQGKVKVTEPTPDDDPTPPVNPPEPT